MTQPAGKALDVKPACWLDFALLRMTPKFIRDYPCYPWLIGISP